MVLMKNCVYYYQITFPKTKYPAFAERLRIAMDLRHYSVADLAEHIFTSTSAISMYRSGKRSPNLGTLCLIALELHVSADFLLGISDTIFI